jgi:hypothetical protein
MHAPRCNSLPATPPLSALALLESSEWLAADGRAWRFAALHPARAGIVADVVTARVLVLFPNAWDRVQFADAKYTGEIEFVFHGDDLFTFPGTQGSRNQKSAASTPREGRPLAAA